MTQDWRELNRANWEDRAAVHAASAFYDLAGFRAGRCTLRDFELEEVGDVHGSTLLHLQCHLGPDTLSWARRGARVTGLDFSPTALDVARDLAARTGLAERARFVEADVYDAVQALAGERFDLVYTGLGALCWLPDLTRWAEVVAACLVPGGRLYLAEFHPITDVLADDGRTLVGDYFAAEGERFDEPRTYTDGPALAHTVTIEWQHPLGEVVTALARAGLRVESLREHASTLFARFPVLRADPDGTYRFPPDHPRLPLMYSLSAVRD